MIETNIVLSVICVLQNDADLLEGYIAELANELRNDFRFFEIILIDDASTDGTQEKIPALLAKTERLRYQRLSRNSGLEVALSAGLETAIGDFVVTLTPGVDPVTFIPEFVQRCRNGSGVVVGKAETPKPASWLQKKGSAIFHAYCRKILGIDFPENTTNFRCLSRNVVNSLTRFQDRHRYLRIFTATAGYEQNILPYQPIAGGRAKLKTSLLDDITHAIEIVVANSKHPLRVVSRLGLFLSLLNALYIGYVVAIYLIRGHVAEGWTTSSLQASTMFFFLFLILAVLCEYVGRILEETQNRPLYFVSEEKQSPMSLESTMTRNIVNESKAEI